MGFLKRFAFYVGMVLGLVTVAAAGTVALIYLFTGKFISVEVHDGKPVSTLMTADEVVAMMRTQVRKAKAAHEIEIQGGEDDVAE
jgi:hypothetical protein